MKGEFHLRREAILLLPLPAQSKLLLIALAHYGGNKNKAWPSQARLALVMKVNRRQVRKYIADLIARDYLTVTYRPPHQTPVYSVNFELVQQNTQDIPERACGTTLDDSQSGPVGQPERACGAPRAVPQRTQSGSTGPPEHSRTLKNTNSTTASAVGRDTHASALKRFRVPTVDEVRAYCAERSNGINAQKFVDYYETRGWKLNGTPMKNWKACVRTWEQNDERRTHSYQPSTSLRHPNDAAKDWIVRDNFRDAKEN